MFNGKENLNGKTEIKKIVLLKISFGGEPQTLYP